MQKKRSGRLLFRGLPAHLSRHKDTNFLRNLSAQRKKDVEKLKKLKKLKKATDAITRQRLIFIFNYSLRSVTPVAQSGDELLLHAGREAGALVPLEALERVVERLVVTGAAVQIAVEELARPAVADVILLHAVFVVKTGKRRFRRPAHTLVYLSLKKLYSVFCIT
jgi:hypothetical protein